MAKLTLMLVPLVVCSAQIPSPAFDTPTAPQLRTYTKSLSAKRHIKMPVGGSILQVLRNLVNVQERRVTIDAIQKAVAERFQIWFDEAKWKQEKSDTDGALKFSSINGVGWAIARTDSAAVPTDDLGKLVLLNEKRYDPNAQITLEEKRIVNGHEILALQVACNSKGMPSKHLGYYYGGTFGTVEVITYSLAAALDDNIDLFTDFLNGLVISDLDETPTDSKPIPHPGLVSFNSSMSLKYDPKKWKLLSSNHEEHFSFSYFRDDGYALISPSPLRHTDGLVPRDCADHR